LQESKVWRGGNSKNRERDKQHYRPDIKRFLDCFLDIAGWFGHMHSFDE
jgi:hypothetical protein